MRKPKGAPAVNIVTYVLCALFLIPVVWMMVVAVKPETVNTTNVANWFTPPFTNENIRNVLAHPQANVFRWIGNSFFVATVTTVGVVVICCLAAFSFSRIPYRGKNVVFVLVIMGMMIPREATLIPLYLLFRNIKLLNSYFSLVAPSIAAPFAIVILKSFFDGLPDSLFQAAKIEGCGWLRMAFQIAFPLTKTAIASLTVLVFLQAWNDFLWPFISITDHNHVTIPVGLPLFRSQYLTGQGLTMAAGALLSAPIIVVFVFMQKYIVKGIATAGIKG